VSIEKSGRPEYGDLDNLRCIAYLKETYRKYQQPHNPAFDHCIEMVLLKIGRIATGRHNDDHITDAIGYLQLARRIHNETNPSR
jgi:hypothetical protein